MAVIIATNGNLTDDPELRQTQNGHQVCDFRIANNSFRRNKDTREFERTNSTFLRCTAWDSLAQNIAASFHKGMSVLVDGRLIQRDYTAQDGSKHSVLELRVDDAGISLKHGQSTYRRTDSPQQGGSYSGQGYQPQTSVQQGAQAYQRDVNRAFQQQPAPRTTQAQRPVQRPQAGASNWASNRDYSNGAGFGGGTADQRPLGPGEDPQF